MTSQKLADKLKELGHSVSAATVRTDWAKGAPRKSVEAYLRWREKSIGKDGRSSQEVRDLKSEKTRKEIELLDERLIAERRENEVKAGLLWPKAEVLAARAASAARVYAVLRSKLLVEIPAQCAGQPAEAIAAANESAIDAACAELSKS